MPVEHLLCARHCDKGILSSVSLGAHYSLVWVVPEMETLLQSASQADIDSLSHSFSFTHDNLSNRPILQQGYSKVFFSRSLLNMGLIANSYHGLTMCQFLS